MKKTAARERQQREAVVAEYLYTRAAELADANVIRQNKVVAGSAGRDALFFGQLRDELAKTFKDKMPIPVSEKQQVSAKKKKKKSVSRILNVIFSDTHYGADLDPREVRNRYGTLEESRRTAAIVRQVSDYKRQYRDETKLYVHFLGDMFQGQLHDARDGAPLAEQICRTGYLLIRAVRHLAAEYPNGVDVFCTPGNHGRNTQRHRERAVLQKWDSNETVIYFMLKEACSNLPNVKVHLGYEPKYEFDVFGNLGMGTHGDTIVKPGYPGRSVDVSSIKKQISDINNARVLKGLKPYKMVILGHVHTGLVVHLAGCIVVTNSCLIPVDPYAVSIGITDTACGQWMWESTKEHIMGHTLFVEVDEKTDKDSSLDNILGIFNGLDG